MLIIIKYEREFFDFEIQNEITPYLAFIMMNGISHWCSTEY